MNYTNLLDETYILIDEIKKDPDYLRLLEVKKLIDTKYIQEIKDFREANDKYSEAKNYGKYHPDLKSRQLKLVETKTSLYSKEEVQEYFNLERLLNKELQSLTNDLTSTVSNKYK